MRSMRRSLCAAMLSLQAVVLFLTTPVLVSLTDVPTGAALGAGVGLTVACLMVVGLLRHEWGYWLGWAIQLATIALGVVVPAMYALGVVFAGLWAAASMLGGKVDRERAATAAPGGA
jgi:hypothetical protein